MTKESMTQENYRKLSYFYENGIKVHFKDFNDVFYNGLILDLSPEKNVIVLNERVKGEMPFLLEHINPDSIRKFIDKDKKEEVKG